MITVLLGALAFPLFFLYDYFNYRKKTGGIIFFLLGVVLLTASSLIMTITGAAAAFASSPALFIAGAVLTAASLCLLVYDLFFALPVFDVYFKAGDASTVQTGVYSICRHPGVWALALTYLFLLAALRSLPALIAFILYTALDVVYVYIQDKYIFPYTLSGYKEYQSSTPFLIPRLRALNKGADK